MAILGISFEKIIKPNVRILTPPIFLVIALVLLGIFVVKSGLERIYAQLNELEDVNKTLAILQEKVDVLREIQGIVLSQADISVISLPEKNPSLLMLTQLNNLAQEKDVTITDKSIQVAESDSSGIVSMQLRLELEGEFTNILSFIRDIQKVAPLSTVEEIDIEKIINEITSNVSLSVYWGDFPTRIPPITEPIKTLTAKEEVLLDQLGNLTRPELTDLKASQPIIRDNPFR